MALTAEDIQKQLEDYFNSDEGKAAIDSITANISDEYTKSEGGGYVRYGNISLEDWQKQNIVTDGNNNTSLSNDQLTQLKTFAAMQPKYDPIKVGGGMGSEIGASATSEADRIRSEELRRTPGPIYTNFAAYSKALQDHNKKIKTYIEDNKIPTSITTPDGIKLELNVGLTPVYYQEQRDGGRLQNTLHMNSDQGYYTQLGGIGQYGSYHRPKLSQSKGFFEGFFKDAAPYFAAFIGAAILGPMAFKYVGSTGMGQFLSTTSSKIIAAVKNAPATFKGIAGAINNTFQGLLTSAGVDAAIAKKVTIDAAGSLAATVKGISYAEQYLDQEDRAAIDAALASATGANGLPGGVVYSGPGAGAEGEINPNVIYNLTAGTTAGATEDEDEDSANTIDATAVVNAAVAAVSTPDENEDVISANTAVSEAEAGVEDATNNVATVVQEENAKVDSAEAYANYVRSRYGVRSFAYRNAKKRADKAKLDAQNEINQARTAASVAQADFENAKKAAIGAQRDAEDEYKKAVAQARRDAEAEVRNKIAKARTDAKAAAEARAAAEETGISEAQDGYSDVAGSAGTYSYDGPETTDYADTTAGQEETKPVEKEEEEVEETKPVEKEEEVEETKPVEKEEEEVEETKPVEKEEEEVEETKPVVTTSDGTDAPATEVKYEEPDEPIEVTTDVEPVEKPEDPPLDIKKPVVEKPVEKPVETTETETDAGGGGGGAGEGAGAGQGGDTGADAEVGTTTAAEKTKVETTETTETPTETADVGLGANEPIDGKWRRDPDDPNGWIHILTGTTFEEGQGGKWRNKSTGEIVEEFTEPEEDEDKPLTEVTGAGTGLGGGADTSSDASASSGTTSGTELGTSGSDTTDTTTTTTTTTTPTAGTDTTTTADTSTGTAGATTTPAETTIGGAGTSADLGTSDTAADEDQAGAGVDGTGTGTTAPADEIGAGDADATGTGTGAADATGTGTDVSDTPGAGAGDEGDPGDVGEGTGTGAGTGTGTGGGTGSGEGTGTGSGTGEGSGDDEGEGKGADRYSGLRSQQLMQLLQPRQVQVKSKPTEELKYIYDISGRRIPLDQYLSPFGLPALGEPLQQRKPMGFKQGGLASKNTDNIFDRKEVGTVNDLLRILRDKR